MSNSSAPEPTAAPATPSAGRGVDADDLAATLRVLGTIHELDEAHPDFVAVRRATSRMFKSVKRHRRGVRRAAIQDNDKAIVGR